MLLLFIIEARIRWKGGEREKIFYFSKSQFTFTELDDYEYPNEIVLNNVGKVISQLKWPKLSIQLFWLEWLFHTQFRIIWLVL